jgi:hypothetical protein
MTIVIRITPDNNFEARENGYLSSDTFFQLFDNEVR